MAQLNVRVDGKAAEWPDDRINALVNGIHVMIDGEPYPIIEGRRDKKGALLVVDTGDGGPAPTAGTVTDLGTVE